MKYPTPNGPNGKINAEIKWSASTLAFLLVRRLFFYFIWGKRLWATNGTDATDSTGQVAFEKWVPAKSDRQVERTAG